MSELEKYCILRELCIHALHWYDSKQYLRLYWRLAFMLLIQIRQMFQTYRKIVILEFAHHLSAGFAEDRHIKMLTPL